MSRLRRRARGPGQAKDGATGLTPPDGPMGGSDDQSAKAVRGRLSSGRLLVRNTLLTIGADGAILVVAVLAVPLLIDGLGIERFGVLTLAWALIGYANIFDLGLGRALTKFTAEKLGDGREEDLPPIFWTAIGLLFAMGGLAAVAVAAVSPWLVGSVLNISSGLKEETLRTFFLLAATIPFVLVSSGLRGSLEAHQRFDLTNAVTVPMSFLTYFGPVLMLILSRDLFFVVSAVAVSRVLACAIYVALSIRVSPALRSSVGFDRSFAGPLLRFGGWVTVASVVTPLMLTLDRFVIAAVISTAAVAYYATPYEAIMKMLILSTAFAAVLFPAFSLTLGHDRERAEKLFSRGARVIFVSLFPLTLAVVAFAYEGLDLWLGSTFAANGATVLQWLAAGVMVNGIAQVAYGLVQSRRPDLIAKVALVELPVYLGGLWLLLGAYGVVGAAVAWTFRVILDGAILYAMLHRLKLISATTLVRIAIPTAGALLLLPLVAQLEGLLVKSLCVALAIIAFAPVAWALIFEAEERTEVRQRLGVLRASLAERR